MAGNTTPKATTKWQYLRDEMSYALNLIFDSVNEGVQAKTKGQQVVFELQQDVRTEIRALGAARNGYGRFILFVPDTANVSDPSGQAEYAGIINDKIESLFEEYAVGRRPRLNLLRHIVTLQRFELMPALNTVQGYVCEARLHYVQIFKKNDGG